MNYYGNGADYAYSGTRQLDSKSNTLLPSQNGIPNSHVILYDNNAVTCDYPYDYKWPRSFSLSKSGYQGNGTYDVYSGTKSTGQPLTTIPQDICTNPNTITAPELANRLGVLSALEKWDTTVSLYAEWEPCHAGWYCPADQEPQKCPIDMTSTTGSSAITQCYTTCEAGYYLPAKSGICAQCENGYYCPKKDTYHYSDTKNQGNISCPSGYPNSNTKSINQNQCYITCNPGKFVSEQYKTCNGSCGKGEYLNSSTTVYYGKTNACTKCTEINITNGYFTTPNSCDFKCNEPDYEKTSDGCQLAKIHCDPGYYLPANSRTCQICEAGYYCPGGYYYPSPSTYQGKNQCQNAIIMNGKLQKIANGSFATKQSNPQCAWSCNAGYEKWMLNMAIKNNGYKLDGFCTPLKTTDVEMHIQHQGNSLSTNILNIADPDITICQNSNNYSTKEKGDSYWQFVLNDCNANQTFEMRPSNKGLYCKLDNIADWSSYSFNGGTGLCRWRGIIPGGIVDLNGYYNLVIIDAHGNHATGNMENYGECSVFLDLPDDFYNEFTTENDERLRPYLVGVGVTDFASQLPYGTKYIFNCHSDTYEVYSHDGRGIIENSSNHLIPVYFETDPYNLDFDWSSFDFGPIGNGFGALI